MSELLSTRIPRRSPQGQQPTLTDQERALLQRLLGYPLDIPGEFVTWMEDRMRLLITASNVRGLAQRVATVGEYKVIAKDLSASSGLTSYDDTQGRWLYANGATFSSTDYPDLADFLGGTTLPNLDGQLLWSTDAPLVDTVVGSVLIKA